MVFYFKPTACISLSMKTKIESRIIISKVMNKICWYPLSSEPRPIVIDALKVKIANILAYNNMEPLSN